MSTFSLQTGTTAINTLLTEEANRIGGDIYSRTLHVSPWLDMIKQTAFADGMGYQQSTLVYDRALPTTDTAGHTIGVNWTDVGTANASANNFNTSLSDQALKDSLDSVSGSSVAGKRSYIQFSKKLKSYKLLTAFIESPRISLEDLRFAAHRQDQLKAIMTSMTESTRNTWENRYRDEYSLVADTYVGCVIAGTAIQTGFEGKLLTGIGSGCLGALGYTAPTANISNAVLDKCYYNLIRKGAGTNAYGRENGRPVFAICGSSEMSYKLTSEAGQRDDIRYNNSRVSELIAPLGVEKAFRGFYHMIDDLAPRFTVAGTGSTTVLTRIQPYKVNSGVTSDNVDYESAPIEAAFIIHPDVCESQIPNPLSGSNGVVFNPVSYRGDFKWSNILNEATNPDGTVGFFRGILSSATKPIKTDFGFVILFKRDSPAYAATTA